VKNIKEAAYLKSMQPEELCVIFEPTESLREDFVLRITERVWKTVWVNLDLSFWRLSVGASNKSP
jgi:hypothetical protein